MVPAHNEETLLPACLIALRRAVRQVSVPVHVLVAAGTKDTISGSAHELAALLPAFMLSELKTSFLIGFQIYLPFLIVDMVIASVLTSMGMMMLPPMLISLPFKLLLFVLVDGWHLIVGMLLSSFQAYT